MLDFFRRYQWYFFLVITIVIVISFSFFGTYSTLSSNPWGEQIAFKAVNGKEVTRLDVDELAHFLATDNEDKMLYGGMWGPNFLNDGVIQKDFLETGIGEQLALAYSTDLESDFNKRLIKEKKFVLYSHPQAQFLNVESAWSHFSPDMKMYFDTLQSSQNALDPNSLNSRVKLYLAERKVPATMLRYVLSYQEQQYNWLKPDPTLPTKDLSLFGYHNLEDWFGPHYTRLVSEFIINTAILAEEKGYTVSKAEVLADLVRNTNVSYQQNLNNPNLGVTSPEEYFNEQLRRLGIDQSRAIKIWRQVLLFRRYFQDAGATALVDNFVTGKIHQHANENVIVDLYQLPPSLHISNYNDLQKFEVYLRAVTKQSKTNPLEIPQQFLTVDAVQKNYPELVQKRYELGIAQVNQNQLQARIGLRELWNWEVDGQNWETLVKQFPTLGIQSNTTREQRFEALDGVDTTTRKIIDAYAKQAITQSHPEWIDQTLTAANTEKVSVGLRTQGGMMPIKGLDNKDKRLAFLRLLDAAPLGENASLESPLFRFTADDQTYYRITVFARADKPEILRFAELEKEDTLDKIRNRMMEKHYAVIRTQNPSLYQKENKEWKPFQEVRESVIGHFFEPVIAALQPLHKKFSTGSEKTEATKDQLASLRFYPYVQNSKVALEKDPKEAQTLIASEESTESSPQTALKDQWKISKATNKINRQNPHSAIDLQEALGIASGEWSTIKQQGNGNFVFYQAQEHPVLDGEPSVIAKLIRQSHAVLGNEAQRSLMFEILEELKSKDALSLAYLRAPRGEDDSSSESEMMAD